MIKGIYLSEEPYMSEFTKVDILSDLNFIYKDSEPDNFSTDNYTIKRESYRGELFITTLYKSNYEPGLKSMEITFKVIQNANPDFLKVFRFGKEKLIVSYPNFYEAGDGEKYGRFMEELIRIVVFLLRYRDPGEVSEMIDEYIELSVSYPSNRIGR